MGIYRRGRVWWADYNNNGKRVQESTGTANRREAEKYLALRVSEVDRGVYIARLRVPLSDLWEKYLANAKIKKRSWKRDVQMFGNLQSFFGNAALDQLNPLRIEEYQQHRAKAVSPATVNREVALLKHMLNLGERWGLCRGPNPVRQVDFLPENNLRFRTLSEEEERNLLSCSPPYLRELILFACNTGLRSGEIFNLKWEDVDLDKRRIIPMVRKTRGLLELPLNDTAHAVLEARAAVEHGPYVFYNPTTGDRFYDLKLGLKGALQRSGLSGVTWHTFRHTFASRLTRSGVDLVTVKELLGHSTVTVTMRYAHTNHDTKLRAVAQLKSCDKVVTVTPRKWKKAV